MYDAQKIWSSNRLPSLPRAAVELLQLSREPKSELGDYVRIIRTDPALTARLLRAANSSQFAFRSEITAIERAMPLLGTGFVTTLALGFSLIDDSVMNGPIGDYYRSYWEKSIIQASAAELAAEIAGNACPDECFQAGLLVDIGELAMLNTMGEDYVNLLKVTQDERRESCEVERDAFGFDHVHIGFKFAETSQLGQVVEFVIQHHHDNVPDLFGANSSEHSKILQAVAVAATVGDFICRGNKGAALERLQDLTARAFLFNAVQLNDFIDRVRDKFAKNAETFNISSVELPSSSELMDEARTQLIELTMQVQIENASVVQRKTELEQESKVLKDENAELQKKVVRDPLTNLYNRNFFDEAVRNELQKCIRTASTIGILFCDVDHFKQLNDNFGHAFGDYVLKRVASLFEQSVRPIDTVARYGGEEFVVLVCSPSENGLRAIAEKIRTAIEKAEFINDERAVQVTMSIGAIVAVPSRDHDGLAAEFIKVADEQMYEAKRNGRNQVRLVSSICDAQRKMIADSAFLFSKWLIKNGSVDETSALEAALSATQQGGKIGELAVAEGLLKQEDIDEILAEQTRTGQRFGTAAIKANKLTLDQAAYLLARQQQEPRAIADVLIETGALDQQTACTLLQRFHDDNVSVPVEVPSTTSL